MNRAVLIGNLAKDVDLRTTPGGTSVCTFTIAVDRKFRDKEGNRATDFLPIVAWGKSAESCGKYLSKGKKVAVAGEIQTRSYDAKDGTKRYVTEVVAEEVKFLSPMQQSDAPMPTELAEAGFTDDGFGEFKEEDMPF